MGDTKRRDTRRRPGDRHLDRTMETEYDLAHPVASISRERNRDTFLPLGDWRTGGTLCGEVLLSGLVENA